MEVARWIEDQRKTKNSLSSNLSKQRGRALRMDADRKIPRKPSPLPLPEDSEPTAQLSAHVGHVDVAAGVDVVKQIPSGMIRVIVNREVVAAVPAPIRGQVPIPIGNLKIDAAREPKAVAIAVKAFDAIAIRRANVFKVAVPVVVAYVWN